MQHKAVRFVPDRNVITDNVKIASLWYDKTVLAITRKNIIFYQKVVAIVMRVQAIYIIVIKSITFPGHSRGAKGIRTEMIVLIDGIFWPASD